MVYVRSIGQITHIFFCLLYIDSLICLYCHNITTPCEIHTLFVDNIAVLNISRLLKRSNENNPIIKYLQISKKKKRRFFTLMQYIILIFVHVLLTDTTPFTQIFVPKFNKDVFFFC